MVIDFNLIELFAKLPAKVVEKQFVILESERGTAYKDFFVDTLIEYIQGVKL